MLDVASSMVREVVALAEDEATRREVRRTRMRLQERGRSAAGSRKTLPDNRNAPYVFSRSWRLALAPFSCTAAVCLVQFWVCLFS